MNMTTSAVRTAKRNSDTCPCPKCDGQGFIRAFAGIANGICFTCGGTKVVKVGRFKPAPATAPEILAKADWIINATPEQIDQLTWAQISRSRNFAHSRIAERPTLRAIWFEKFNDRFCQLQDIEWQKINDRIQASWGRR